MARIAWLVGCTLVLAALDMAGALLAQQYAERRVPYALGLGALTFVVLFVVYALALEHAQLSVVTLGWIVLLQVGLLAVDVGRGRLQLDRAQVAAVVGVLVLQGYLVLSTAPEEEVAAPAAPPATPYLELDLGTVAASYADLAAALPGVRLHYAVKANPAPEVLDLLVRAGAAFDVASPAEVHACLAAGASPADLSYGNTVKKEDDVRAAWAQGVRVFAVDQPAELDKVSRAAPGSTVCCRLRTSGAGADWALSDKFGCPPEEALELLTGAARRGHPVGLSFHVGSQQRDPLAWDAPLATCGRLQQQLAERGVRLALLNVGGGFPGTYRRPVPEVAEYGRAIRAGLAAHLREPLPVVVAEPGRSLVADAGVLHTSVVLVGERAGRRWVHLDVGLFGGLVETLDEAVEYPVSTDLPALPDRPVVLAGPTCDSIDVLYERADYRLPLALGTGDRLRLHSTGAYTASCSSVGFNGLAPLPVHVVDRRAAAAPVLPRPRRPGGARQTQA